jgi:hypothetical protein
MVFSRGQCVSHLLRILRFSSLGAISVLAPVLAQPRPEAKGELVSAAHAMINGSVAVSGTTIFSDNRVATSREGAAIINLGKLGRVELEAETDMTLRFSDGRIGGELHSGRAVLSAPAGVVISVSTTRSSIITDGAKGAALAIQVDSGRAQIVTLRGQARMVSGSQVAPVTENPPAVTSKPSSNFTSLLGVGITNSLGHSAPRSKDIESRDNDRFLESTVTCRDHYQIRCRRRGAVRP